MTSSIPKEIWDKDIVLKEADESKGIHHKFYLTSDEQNVRKRNRYIESFRINIKRNNYQNPIFYGIFLVTSGISSWDEIPHLFIYSGIRWFLYCASSLLYPTSLSSEKQFYIIFILYNCNHFISFQYLCVQINH